MREKSGRVTSFRGSLRSISLIKINLCGRWSITTFDQRNDKKTIIFEKQKMKTERNNWSLLGFQSGDVPNISAIIRFRCNGDDVVHNDCNDSEAPSGALEILWTALRINVVPLHSFDESRDHLDCPRRGPQKSQLRQRHKIIIITTTVMKCIFLVAHRTIRRVKRSNDAQQKQPNQHWGFCFSRVRRLVVDEKYWCFHDYSCHDFRDFS